jgi:hypothetical protein
VSVNVFAAASIATSTFPSFIPPVVTLISSSRRHSRQWRGNSGAPVRRIAEGVAGRCTVVVQPWRAAAGAIEGGSFGRRDAPRIAEAPRPSSVQV